jgi:hypothetical protein
MIYRRLGYVKVNRAARHSFWTDCYRSHRLRNLVWGIGLFLLFVMLFLALVNVAIQRGVEALMGR